MMHTCMPKYNSGIITVTNKIYRAMNTALFTDSQHKPTMSISLHFNISPQCHDIRPEKGVGCVKVCMGGGGGGVSSRVGLNTECKVLLTFTDTS